MSTPEPMRCIHPVECPSPMRCNDAGGCIESRKDGYRSWNGAIAACREQGIRDPFRARRERDVDHG